jgi:hypothetical protein
VPITLNGVRTVVLLVAASLSVGGYAYRYMHSVGAPTHGELVTVVRGGPQTPLSDAHVEVFTLDNARVSSFPAAAPSGGPRSLREGTYRVRVSHPRYAPATRLVHVAAGQTSEVRFQLDPAGGAR